MTKKRKLSDDDIFLMMQNDMFSMAKENLLAFASSCNKKYVINWHHKIICDRLTKLASEKQKRVMIFLPPQTGKSEIVSRIFPIWMLGLNPKLRIIIASYASDLAISFNRDAQKLIEGENYGNIFPETYINGHRNVTGGSWKRTSNFFETVGHGGYLFSVGVGGATTGKSADIFIIDDPFKDMQQAYSPVGRKRVIDWYNSVAQTRLSLNGHIIIMHTRWHENDLAGYLLEQAAADSKATQWEVISIPAIGSENNPYRHPKDHRKEGQPLWPAFKGDEAMLEVTRKSVGEKVWSALYQQRPSIEGGNIIKESWFRFYTQLPIKIETIPSHKIIQSWDLTFKETGSSFVVGVVLFKHDADFYLLDFYRSKADVVTTVEAIRTMSKKYPNASILIEDKANGPAVLSLLKKELSRLIPVRPTAGKDERLHVVAPFFEAGNVYLPANAPWTRLVMAEIQQFPNSEHDDIVDAVSQGLQHFSKLTGMRHLEAMTRI